MTLELLQSLVSKSEKRNVDYKDGQRLTKPFQAHLAATIASMANIPGGGRILIGVKDSKPPEIQGMDKDSCNTYDITTLNKYLIQRLDPLPKIEFEFVELGNGKTVVTIEVQEFDDLPIIVKKPIASEENKYADQGDILIRTETRETKRIDSAIEMREFLNLALSRRTHSIIKEIQQLLSGEINKDHLNIETEFRSILPEFQSSFEKKRDPDFNYAFWVIKFLPLPIENSTILPNTLMEVLRNTVVDKIDPFPIFFGVSDRIRHMNGYSKIESDWESWHMSHGGGFGGFKIPYTERRETVGMYSFPPPPLRPVFFEEIILTIYSLITFAINIGSRQQCEAIWFNVSLNNIKDRKIQACMPDHIFWGTGQSHERMVKLLDQTIAISELIAKRDSLVISTANRLFQVFQVTQLNEGIMKNELPSILG